VAVARQVCGLDGLLDGLDEAPALDALQDWLGPLRVEEGAVEV